MSVVMPRYECTHKQAVKRVATWMTGSQRLAVVLAERVTLAVSETPDVIGWNHQGHSILVECKVSRSDFHADKNKHFRRYEELGVGSHRYFAAPRGLLAPEDMPEGWGLLEITEGQVREKRAPEPKQANKQAEVAMLVSAMRRLEMAATVFVRHEDSEPQNTPVQAAPRSGVEPGTEG